MTERRLAQHVERPVDDPLDDFRQLAQVYDILPVHFFMYTEHPLVRCRWQRFFAAVDLIEGFDVAIVQMNVDRSSEGCRCVLVFGVEGPPYPLPHALLTWVKDRALG